MRISDWSSDVCSSDLIAPSGYRRHAALRRAPHRRCARAKRDELLVPQIERVWRGNMQVYGADKVWRQLQRERFAVARCTVERLMRQKIGNASWRERMGQYV